jgi:LmbE family N-acetylglucosaminyl deacetylase
MARRFAGGAPAPRVLAIGAHPDDIEFYMAGTLLLLGEQGYGLHYLNISTGNCGSVDSAAARTRATRRREAQNAAAILGAKWHPALADDLEILYELAVLRRLSALIREIQPQIVLTHSPQDYMEDHTNTCRLAVTAAFARGMPNFRTVPSRRAVGGPVTVYHAMPHGLQDGLRQKVMAGAFVDTTSVHARKTRALSAHQSQKNWLDASQGMNSYIQAMDNFSRAVGKMSRGYPHAEGWRRHSHFGFCAETDDPLRTALGSRYRLNLAFESSRLRPQ